MGGKLDKRSKGKQTLLGYPIVEASNSELECGGIEIISWEEWKKSLDKENIAKFNKLK